MSKEEQEELAAEVYQKWMEAEDYVSMNTIINDKAEDRISMEGKMDDDSDLEDKK